MAFKSSLASTALTAAALTSTSPASQLVSSRNKMNPWKLEEEQEGTRDEAEGPLCGRASAEQGDEG